MFRRPGSDSEDEDYYGGSSSSKKNEIESSLERVMSGRNAREPSEEPAPSEANEEELQQEIISRDDLNKMAAKVLKAELKGDKDKATKLSEKLERARKAFEATSSSTIMLEVDKRTGTAKPAGFKTRHDRAREAEHEMLNKFISSGDRTEQEIKKREDRRSRKRGPETEQDQMNKLRQKNAKYEQTIGSCEICSSVSGSSTFIVHQFKKFVFGVTKKNFTQGFPFYIIPREHYVSSVVLDEDYSEELAEIKVKLVDYYEKKEKSLIFFEIFKPGKHMVLEVLQVDKYMANSLRRLLLNEFEMNNDETSARAYRDLSSVPGGLKRAIAEGISYTWFTVDKEPGYLQRISKPEKFDDDFYYKVLGAELIEDFDEMQLAQKLTPCEVREKLKKLQMELQDIK